jgi:phosphatidylethanolamine-binding protein (PEBP) family uncharacterized protein
MSRWSVVSGLNPFERRVLARYRAHVAGPAPPKKRRRRMSHRSLLEYMGIDTDLIEVQDTTVITVAEAEEGSEYDCS